MYSYNFGSQLEFTRSPPLMVLRGQPPFLFPRERSPSSGSGTTIVMLASRGEAGDGKDSVQVSERYRSIARCTPREVTPAIPASPEVAQTLTKVAQQLNRRSSDEAVHFGPHLAR